MKNNNTHLELIETLNRALALIDTLRGEHGKRCRCDLCRSDLLGMAYNLGVAEAMLSCQLPVLSDEEFERFTGKPLQVKRAG